MKKFKKSDFKTLALLGMASGTTVLASQANANDLNNFSQLLAFNTCGGSNAGCGGAGINKGMGGSSGGYSYQAYRNIPSQDAYSDQGQWQSSQQSSGCNGKSEMQNQWQPSQSYGSCNGTSGQWQSNQMPSDGYTAMSSGGSSGGMSSGGTGSYGSSGTSTGGYGTSGTGSYGSGTGSYGSGTSGYGTSGTGSYGSGSGYGNSGTGSSSGMSGSQSQPGQWQSGQSQSGQTMPNQSTPGQYQSGQQQRSPFADNSRGSSQWDTSGSSDNSSRSGMKRTLSDSELQSQLNDQGKAAYQSLDANGKALALKLANQDCKGQNECKGLNSCKTEDHACAGKGSCSGTANSNFKDKNLAVKVAAMKMADKRSNATSSKY